MRECCWWFEGNTLHIDAGAWLRSHDLPATPENLKRAVAVITEAAYNVGIDVVEEAG